MVNLSQKSLISSMQKDSINIFDDTIDGFKKTYDHAVQKIGVAIGKTLPDNTVSLTLANGGLFPFTSSDLLDIYGTPSILVPNAFGFLKEVVEAIADILNILINKILIKLDVIIAGGAARLQTERSLIANDFNTIVAGTTFHELFQDISRHLQDVLYNAYYQVNNLLHSTSLYVRNILDKAGIIIITGIEALFAIACDFLPRRIEDELLYPAHKKLEELEEQLFADTNQVLDKIIIATERRRFELEWKIDCVAATSSKIGKGVLSSLMLNPQNLSLDVNRFKFWKAYLEEMIKVDRRIIIEEKLSIYAELQKKASLMSFLKGGIVAAPHQNDLLTCEWLNYGVLFNETKVFIGPESPLFRHRQPSLITDLDDELEPFFRNLILRNLG